MRSRTALWSLIFLPLPAVAGPDFTPIRWHVDITGRDTVTIDIKENDGHGTWSRVRQEGQFHLVSDDDGPPNIPGTSAYRVDASPAHASAVTAAWSKTEEGGDQNQYGGHEHSSKDIQQKVDRDHAEYSFEYESDRHWNLSITIPVSGSGSTHECAWDNIQHIPKHCDDNTVPATTGTVGAITAADQGGKITPTKDGFVIDWSHDDNGNSEPSHGRTEHHHVELHAVLTRNAAEPKYDAVLVPDPKTYETWVPEGPKLPDGKDEDGGNELAVKLEIRDHKTHKPVPAAGFAVTYTLASSHIPGWCMNAPAQKDANAKPDLFFFAKSNKGHDITDADAQTAKLVAGTGADTIVVRARDYGAYGKLTAKVTFLDGGQTVDAKVDLKGVATADELTIPVDRNANHIADGWEKQYKLYDQNLPGKTDREDVPAKMATTGDGYTLYEEYRGFWLDERASVVAWATSGGGKPKAQHTRLDPTRKELLVFPSGPRSEVLVRGALMWGDATKIQVYVVPDSEHLAPYPSDPATFDMGGKAVAIGNRPRWPGFNRARDEQLFGRGDGQVVVRIMSDFPIGVQGVTPPIEKPQYLQNPDRPLHMAPVDAVGVLTPRGAVENQINGWVYMAAHAATSKLDWAPQFLAAFAQLHVDAGAVAKHVNDPKVLAALVDAFQSFIVMHELGHNTGSEEHDILGRLADTRNLPDYAIEDAHYGTGSASCPQYYWQFRGPATARVELLLGRWDPRTVASNHQAWQYCDTNWGMMRLRQRPGQEWDDDVHGARDPE